MAEPGRVTKWLKATLLVWWHRVRDHPVAAICGGLLLTLGGDMALTLLADPSDFKIEIVGNFREEAEAAR